MHEKECSLTVKLGTSTSGPPNKDPLEVFVWWNLSSNLSALSVLYFFHIKKKIQRVWAATLAGFAYGGSYARGGGVKIAFVFYILFIIFLVLF